MTDIAEIRRSLERFRRDAEHAELAVNLVPSENRMSPLARIPLATDYYNRYFFNFGLDPEYWQFRGGQEVAELEVGLAVRSLRRLGAAEHVNVRPVSGMSAMTMAMAALGGSSGGVVVSIAQSSGGHHATCGTARGLGFTSMTLPVSRGAVDEPLLAKVLQEHRPVLVYLDLANGRHELQVSRVRELIDAYSPRTRLHVDCSHTLGLVLGGVLDNPLDTGADSMGGSTHKTFPGPHKGVLFTRSAELDDRLNDVQYSMLSSHHFAETLALAFASAEFLHFGRDYAKQVISNAQLLGKLLAANRFDVVADEGGFVTATHQVWVKVGDAERTNALARALYAHNVRVNVQVDLPHVPGPVFRLGLNELTFLGGREDAVHAVAEELAGARDGRRQDGNGGVRIRERCEEPFFWTDLV
ncbi:aminotransferase class I/II-fold pyridoxal phosphate-dependent enzyme [Streptomyces sp. NPDC017520]|uniref:aminotransferase class I/II-fold pyridoxal phosphate-dependent enzyme n=1 Tax=Streptomyces sp. NPDC017520 TaxID=3364998 RepID=UPI00378B0E6F